MQPNDYTSAFQGIARPVESFGQGYQIGAMVRNDQQQQQALAEAQAQARKQAAAQAQMQVDMNSVFESPTTEGIARLAVKYPHLSKQFKDAHDMLAPDQQRARIGQAAQVYAAVESGRPDIARQLLESQAKAQENSGDRRGAGAARMWAGIIEKDPKSFTSSAGLMLASVMGDKFTETFGKLGEEARANALEPVKQAKLQADVKKTQAEAYISGVEATNAQEKAVLGNEKTATDIQATRTDAQVKVLRLDIDREANRIKTMEAVFSRETNELKRQELQLKIDSAKQEIETKRREIGDGAQASMNDLTVSHSLVKSILSDEDTLRAAVGTSAWRASLPGSKAKSMAGKIEQLQNAIAAVNLDKLKGALSDKDILFLKSVGANLNRYQNEDEFISELHRIDESMKKAQSALAQSGKLPVTGGGVLMSHPKYGVIDEGRVNALMRQHNATRDEVLQFLGDK